MRKSLHTHSIIKKASSFVAARLETLEDRRLLSVAPIYTDDLSTAVSAPTTGQTANAIVASDFKNVALNLGGIFYYSPFWPFADALKMESRGFMSGEPNQYSVVSNNQLDSRGFVTTPGLYNAKPFENSYHPNGAPRGVYVVTWEGDGDVKLTNYSGSGLDGGVALIGGSVAEKRLVYRVNPASSLTRWWPKVRVNNVAGGGNYVKNIHVWMPDPSDPTNKSLEPAPGDPAPLWHPDYIAHLQELAGQAGYFRFMDWLETNASPQVNWSDSRPADHAFANGNTNWKKLNVPGINNPDKYGEIGVAWEWIIDLSNRLNVNPWINIPHAATDDYVQHVADLFAGKTASPGLNPGLKVYVEYSNEIWSSGAGFAQGDWATQQSQLVGLTKPAFNGKRAVEVFRIFGQEFATAPGGSRANDIIRVAAGFSGQKYYTETYLDEMKLITDGWIANGEPSYMGDVLAITTYFGNASLIKYLFNEIDWLNVNLSDANDPRIQQAFDEWTTNLVLSASNFNGGQNRQTADKYGLKYLAYEGGPSLYTESVRVYLKDGRIVDSTTPGATSTFSLASYVKQNYPDDDTDTTNSDRFTKFIMALNRHPRMAEVYQAQMEVYKARGMKTHAAFTDIGGWNKFGQWGHKEYLGQTSGYNYGDAVKWQVLKDFAVSEQSIRYLDQSIGLVPSIPAISTLPSVYAGQNFSYDINALAMGDGTGAQHDWKIIAGYLPTGLNFTRFDDDTARISGVPTKEGVYRVMVRLTDADNDPAYSIYTINVLASTGVSQNYSAVEDGYAQPGSSQTYKNTTEDTLYAGTQSGSTGDRIAYIKFDLTNLISGDIDSAKLRLYIRGLEGTAIPFIRTLRLYGTSDLLGPNGPANTQWTEDNLQWNFAPAASVSALAPDMGLASDPKGWVEFDVTNYLKDPAVLNSTDGFASFAVRGSLVGGDNAFVGVKIASREYAGGDFAPQIILNQSPADSFTPLRADVTPIIPNPRSTPLGNSAGTVPSATVVFNKAVSGFDPSDIILKKHGTIVSLSGVTLSTTDNKTFSIYGLYNPTQGSGLYSLSIKVAGSDIIALGSSPVDPLAASDTETWTMTGSTSILNRYVFYNNSYYDGNNLFADALDDAAIATDKVALRPGQTATFANYTSYSKGINGVIIDLTNLPFGELTEADLGFKVGNSSTPGSWTALTTLPDVNIRHGGGKNGSDRITLIWPDGTIKNNWLQVTVKATENTGLTVPDVFYFGNVVGDTGDSSTNTRVNSNDILRVRNNQSGFGSAAITNLFDIDRSGKVNSNDIVVVRSNQTGFTPVQLISV